MPDSYVHIGHPNAEYVRITIMGRSYPSATNYSDGNWLNAQVSIIAGGFTGQLEGYLRTEEFIPFKDELSTLYKNLSGTASFDTIEEWLSIKVSSDSLGHLTIECLARDTPGMGNALTFSVEIDQSFLPGILQSLEEVMQLFPVIGTPTQ